MALFVVAHGAWGAGWTWKKMHPLLGARGHQLVTPTYTGLGERGHLARPDIDLETHIADQGFDLGKVAHEITHRWYLIVGGTAWLGLAALAATSTDGMVRRLGGLRWRSLHQAVYGIALLALIHYFQQTKADVTVPVFVAGLFLWLIAYRVLAWWQGSAELSTLSLLGLSIVVSILVFAGEAVGIGIAFHVSPLRVLAVDLDFNAGVRPGWEVLGAGLAVVALDFVRARWGRRPSRARAVAAE